MCVWKIQDHRPFAAIVELEQRARRLDLEPDVVHRAAVCVASWTFDLDHVGAPVGEQRTGGRPGDPHREFDHADADQRTT